MVDRLSAEGEGVARQNDRALFILGALPGERVRVAAEAAGKVQRAALLEVLASPSASSPAVHWRRCGGCDWAASATGAQRAAREEALLAALTRLGGPRPPGVGAAPDPRRGRPRHPSTGGAHLGWERRCAFRPGGPTSTSRVAHIALAVVEPLAALLTVGPAARALAQDAAHGPARRGRAGRGGAPAQGAPEAAGTGGGAGPGPGRSARSGPGAVRQGPTVATGRPTLRSKAPSGPEVPLFLRPEVFTQAHGVATPPLVQRALALLRPEAGRRGAGAARRVGTFTSPLAADVDSVLAVEGRAPRSVWRPRQRQRGGGQRPLVQGMRPGSATASGGRGSSSASPRRSSADRGAAAGRGGSGPRRRARWFTSPAMPWVRWPGTRPGWSPRVPATRAPAGRHVPRNAPPEAVMSFERGGPGTRPERKARMRRAALSFDRQGESTP
jgi:23S rRNA (uracil1939-C5)-methyltransferase